MLCGSLTVVSNIGKRVGWLVRFVYRPKTGGEDNGVNSRYPIAISCDTWMASQHFQLRTQVRSQTANNITRTCIISAWRATFAITMKSKRETRLHRLKLQKQSGSKQQIEAFNSQHKHKASKKWRYRTTTTLVRVWTTWINNMETT